MDINHRLRDLRVDSNMVQKEIAAILNISQRTYSDYERGRSKLSISQAISLAKFYNVSCDYILGITNEKREFPTN